MLSPFIKIGTLYYYIVPYLFKNILKTDKNIKCILKIRKIVNKIKKV